MFMFLKGEYRHFTHYIQGILYHINTLYFKYYLVTFPILKKENPVSINICSISSVLLRTPSFRK